MDIQTEASSRAAGDLILPHGHADSRIYVGLRYNLKRLRLWPARRMKKLTLSDYQALAAFRYQIRKFLHFSEQAVKQTGLEHAQYQLLLAIKGMPTGVRPRVRNLASQMQIRHHSAVELINRLEAGGYVHRERAQVDRREVLLTLTVKGERILEELALHHHSELRTAGPGLIAVLGRVLQAENSLPHSSGTSKEKPRTRDKSI